jgi:hypothetical protein
VNPPKQYEKSEVGYEHPAKGPKHCSQCRHFQVIKRCEIVKGVILPQDWCRKFSAKAGIQLSGLAR